MTKALVLLGGGGHSIVVAGLAKACGYEIHGVIDPSPNCKAVVKGGYTYLGADEICLKEYSANLFFACAIGSERSCNLREKIFTSAKQHEFQFPTLIHPRAYVSPTANIGQGTQVMAGAVIQDFAVVQDNVIINTSASIDHECSIASHSHLAPGVRLSGCVQVGVKTHIGTGAVVIQNIKIGGEALVAAGAVVVKDIPPQGKVRGVPARPY